MEVVGKLCNAVVVLNGIESHIQLCNVLTAQFYCRNRNNNLQNRDIYIKSNKCPEIGLKTSEYHRIINVTLRIQSNTRLHLYTITQRDDLY